MTDTTVAARPLIDSAVGERPLADPRHTLRARNRQTYWRVSVAAGIAALMMAFFVLYDALDAWQIIAKLRLTRMLALVVVAVALSAATAVFQAVTRNRILSPSVMGFDAMFALVATASVFFLTAEVVNLIPASLTFLIQATLMTFLSVAMFTAIVGRGRNSVHLLVLVGIVVGALLRAITTMMAIVMDPNQYLNVADRQIASFAAVNTPALTITAVVTVVVVAAMWWRAPTWDLLALGPDVATSLGVHYPREVKVALAAASILVAAATALTGPLLFFGLLIVNITIFAINSARLRHTIIGSAAIGVVVLVGGQAILEHVLHRATVLPVIIELVGGILLLTMIVKESRR